MCIYCATPIRRNWHFLNKQTLKFPQRLSWDPYILPKLQSNTYCNNAFNHFNSLETEARALYYASVEDLDTVTCFLDFHEISESPKNTQNSAVDFLVFTQLPQYTSQYAVNLSALVQENNKPWPRVAFKYLSKWCKASNCTVVGLIRLSLLTV